MRIILSLLLLTSNIVVAQQYERLDIKPTKELDSIGQFRYILHYELDDLDFYVGMDLTDDRTERSGLRLRVYDSNMNLKFESPGQLDSYTYNPTFFKNESLSPQTILLVHISNEGSWGQDVYIIKDSQIEHIGLINVATWGEEAETYWDIAPYTQIKKVRDTLIFSFTPLKIVLDPSGLDEKTLNGNDLWYEYQNGKLQVKNNN